MTWCSLDRAIWVAAFGDEALLQKVIADPKEFMAHREDLVIAASDQVPVWFAGQGNRQVYTAEERSFRRKDRNQGVYRKGGMEVVSQKDEAFLDQAPRQKRGQGRPEADRLRVTYEARQVIWTSSRRVLCLQAMWIQVR